MKKITLLLMIFTIFSANINAQNNYEELWRKVEKLEIDNLPKSALKIVNEIYDVADKNNNSPQIIKSLFYQSKFSIFLEENAQLKVIKEFKKHISKSNFPTKNVLSKYKWQDGLGYYESTKDAATNFFFDRLPKGVYVFEYDVRVNNASNFSNGITTIQSMYAPEYSNHSEGLRIKVDLR